MALADSKQAIGAVSALLKTQLTNTTSVGSVDIGRPDTAAGTAGHKYNLFLYQVDIDAHLRNQSLDNGQKSPLWLVLKYLLTAFDVDKESDSVDAHELLGEGMLALQEFNSIHPSSINLADNPEPLKVTFDNTDSELLSKLMQGTDEKYRVSVAFQVRPVMIAPTQAPAYSLPVKTVGPPGNEGVVVIPSLGPRLASVTPQKFIAGTELTINGIDVNASISQVVIGDQAFGLTAAAEGQVKILVPTNTTLAAGSHALFVRRDLPAGMELKSDCVAVQLLPDVNIATPGVPTALTTTMDGVHGDLSIVGNRLGGVDDSIFVAFYRDGNVALMLEAAGSTAQTSLLVSVSEDQALAAGIYFIIVRVNGAQALTAPDVNWS